MTDIASFPSPDAIERFLAGEASPEEAATVERWLAADPRRKASVRALKTMDAWAAAPEAKASLSERWEEVAGQIRGVVPLGRRERGVIHAQSESGMPSLRGKQALALRRWPLRQAATAVAAAAVVSLIAVVVLNRQHTQWRPQARTYATAAGQQATIRLADGSCVLLGSATTVSVAIHSVDASPEVHVNGQALFMVSPRHNRLFQVQAGSAVLRVLGTTFMIRRYATDTVARVVVTEGRVSLFARFRHLRGIVDATRSHVLDAGTLGTVNDSGRVQVTPNIAVEDYTAWTTGRLVFRNTPAHDAVAELGRAYGVEIRITDSTLAVQPLSATIPIARRSLTDILESLVDVLDAHSIRTGQTILLMPGRSPSRHPAAPFSFHRAESHYGK